MTLRAWLGVLLIVSLVSSGCFSKTIGEPHVKTTPVSGILYVDGAPTAGVTVECHPEADSSEKKRSVITRTDNAGKFCFTTYNFCDGLPEGTYTLTFKWKTITSGQKDQFNGAYADPQKSKHQITIEDRNPVDLGIIELSAKDTAK